MRFFTDKDNNFSWAAVGGICAIIGSVLAVLTFVKPGSASKDVAAINIDSVLGDYFAGDKIEGISIEQYEQGLQRRETQIVELLKDTNMSALDARKMRETLSRIDAQQADLQSSYRNVEALTAEIRAYHENASDREKVEQAVLDIFDGDLFSAADKAISAGIPVESVGTIENTSSIFQLVRTKADFLRYVAGRGLTSPTDQFYVMTLGRNGSLRGVWRSNLVQATGSWSWIDGKYCREFMYEGNHNPQKCFDIYVTDSAVKFQFPGEAASIWAK